MAVIEQMAHSGSDVVSRVEVPGVDVVLSTADDAQNRLLDEKALKTIGSLHRRFWSRRRELLLHGAQSGITMTSAEILADENGQLTCNLRGEHAATWQGRIDELARLEHANKDTVAIAIRGWDVTEPAVLVDGRAAPGCVFDLVVALRAGADRFHKGEIPFSVVAPTPSSPEEARLWDDLLNAVQDRLGIDRGSIVVSQI